MNREPDSRHRPKRGSASTSDDQALSRCAPNEKAARLPGRPFTKARPSAIYMPVVLPVPAPVLPVPVVLVVVVFVVVVVAFMSAAAPRLAVPVLVASTAVTSLPIRASSVA